MKEGDDGGHTGILCDRSPRPYQLNEPDNFDSSRDSPSYDSAVTPLLVRVESSASFNASRRSSGPDQDGSESGTEADDERPRLLALPPAGLVPRKGLIHQDGSVSPLLTPTQLDRQGQRLLSGSRYRGRRSKKEDEAALEQERRKFEAQRRAERIRRLSEAALLGAIGACVVYGTRIWQLQWQWYLFEVLSQVVAIFGLVAFYPLRLVSVKHDAGHLHIWSRFHVPPSFDPATILYPTFLPVLIALCLVRHSPNIFLPNLILGLATLPIRLFPVWSKAAPINVLHWTVTIVPLAASRLSALLARRFSVHFSGLSAPDNVQLMLHESLLLLFPLHHALLFPIHYLTTSSLLPSEKHLLATALINVLLFSTSPQNVFLKAALWIGGTGLLICCTKVLTWNVALARMPSWRLHALSNAKARRSCCSWILAAIVSVLGKPDTVDESDSDGDFQSLRRVRTERSRAPSLGTFPVPALATTDEQITEISLSDHRPTKPVAFPLSRRNTIGSSLPLKTADGELKTRRAATRRRDWIRRLTPGQAILRKQVYAIYIYVVVAVLVVLPIRSYISSAALDGSEPIFWAIDYFFDTILSTPVTSIIARVSPLLDQTFSLPMTRQTLTPSLTRLCLIVYYALILTTGLGILLFLSPTIQVDTRRKIFHAIMVAMLLPSIPVDPCFVALVLILVLALFLLLEVIRAGQVPPLGTAIGRFVAPYVDGRDLRGPMVVSHVFLLIGCAIPCWLSLGAMEREVGSLGWELSGERREVAMVSGVVCVGMGDAAASLVGRRIGRRKWPWIGGKSLEGSAAFALAVWLGLALSKSWLWLGGWADVHPTSGVLGLVMWSGKALLAGCGASFMEAVLTGANDNVVVPVALWLLCRGLWI